MSSDTRKLLIEALKRQEQNNAKSNKISAILAELYPQQLQIAQKILKRQRKLAIIGSRRSGKTSIWPRAAVALGLQQPAKIRLWGPSRLGVKALVFSEIQLLLERHKIPHEVSLQELTFTFNNSEIHLVGADDEISIQRKRGLSFDLEIVLEAQNFNNQLEIIVRDVIGPGLIDRLGTLVLEGTPGYVPSGLWYELTGKNPFQRQWTSKGYDTYRLLVDDNPFIPHWPQEKLQILKDNNWTETSEAFLREYRGEWVIDTSNLLFKPPKNHNFYTEGPKWSAVLGIDVGVNDKNALVVLSWHPNKRELFESYSWHDNCSLDQLAQNIKSLEKRFNLVALILDTGGLGRLMQQELWLRHQINCIPAKKSDKGEAILAINDALDHGRLLTIPNSPLDRQLRTILKERKDTGKLPIEDPTSQCDLGDACLYAYRYAQEYGYQPAQEPKDLPAQFEEYSNKLEQKLIREELNKAQDRVDLRGDLELDDYV